MGAVWFRCRAEVRSAWRSWLGLTVLVAVAAGVVLFTLAGAQRTDSAWDRLVKKTKAHDAFVIGQQFDFDLDAVARLPEVADVVPVAYVAAATDFTEPLELTPLVSVDGGFLGRMDLPKVLEGRRPHADRADEVAITPPVADKHGLRVGSTFVLRPFTQQQFGDVLSGAEAEEPAGPHITMRVVGIEVSANEGELSPSIRSGNNIHLTPAFARTYAGRVGMGAAIAVRLNRGAADQPSFRLGVERIAEGRPVQLTSQESEGSKVRHSIHTHALALELFAAFATLVALLAVGQALARQTFIESIDHPALRALGMTRHQHWAAMILRGAVIGVGGAAVAVVLAVVASPRMPLGLARIAEPSPGMSFDATVLGLGALAVPVIVVALTVLSGWRAARTAGFNRPEMAATRAAPIAERLARLGLSPVTVTGVRLAVDPGRGRTAAPTRSAVLGTAFSIAALTATLVFGASLDHLVSTPRLYGWNWDVFVGNPYTTDLSAEIVPQLRSSRQVGGFSAVAAAEVDVGGVRTQAYGFETLQGGVLPPVVDGRAPEQPDEIVLGSRVLRKLDREVGHVVDVRVGDAVAPYRIVGEGVFPQLSIFEVESLGRGALLTGEGLRRLIPEAQQNVFPLDWAAGTDVEAATREFGDRFNQTVGISGPDAPIEIANFGQVDGMPAILSALVALIAVAALVHALVTTVRRRRRDLAILKTLGFERAQVWGTVAWQATTMAMLALAVGLPLGVAAGRWMWLLFAGNLGIVPEPVIPLLAVLLVVPAAIVVANLVAALPGRVAARTRPALVLRSE